MIHFILLQSSR